MPRRHLELGDSMDCLYQTQPSLALRNAKGSRQIPAAPTILAYLREFSVAGYWSAAGESVTMMAELASPVAMK